MRILSLDYGDKHTGVALGDLPSILELPPIHTSSLDFLLSKIKELIITENIEAIVVGLPIHSNSKQQKKTEKFISYLEDNFSIPIHKVDESGTSKESFSEMFTKHSGIKKIKKKIHSTSAAKILERFWDSN